MLLETHLDRFTISSGLRAIFLGLSISCAAGCGSSIGAGQNGFEPLIRTLADRIEIADQVALSKWDTKQPVYDPPREAKIIANVMANASAYGLAAADAAQIFRDQIEASKDVQYVLLNRWRRLGRAPETPRQSLPDVIRPELDERKRVTSTVLTELSIAPSIGRESHQRGVGSTQIE